MVNDAPYKLPGGEDQRPAYGFSRLMGGTGDALYLVSMMTDAKEAIHAMRNDLSPILFFAQMASTGDCDAQKLVIDQLVKRTEAIRAELNVLDEAVKRAQQRG